MASWGDFVIVRADGSSEWLGTIKGNAWPDGTMPKEYGDGVKLPRRFPSTDAFRVWVRRFLKRRERSGLSYCWSAGEKAYPWGTGDDGNTKLISDYIYVLNEASMTTGALEGNDRGNLFPDNLPQMKTESKMADRPTDHLRRIADAVSHAERPAMTASSMIREAIGNG